MPTVYADCPLCEAEQQFEAEYSITPGERATYEDPGSPEEREMLTRTEHFTACPECGAIFTADELEEVQNALENAMESDDPSWDDEGDSDYDYDNYRDNHNCDCDYWSRH